MKKNENPLVTRKQLDNILELLESADTDTRTLGFATLDSIDFNNNVVELLCFLKLKSVKVNNTDTPKLHKQFVKNDLDQYLKGEYFLINWGTLMMHFANNKVEHFDTCIRYFEEYTKDALTSVGYDFIDTLKITVKKKQNE
jgi:hypothetical protein